MTFNAHVLICMQESMSDAGLYACLFDTVVICRTKDKGYVCKLLEVIGLDHSED